jgi:hypothetical protein
MAMHTVQIKDRNYKLGRRRPVARGPRFSLSNYLLRSFPDAPPRADFSGRAQATLANAYLNDSLGDCVIAGGAHARGVTSGGAGGEVVFTEDQIVQMYSAIGGYDPNATLNPDGTNPTDNGCDEQTALNYWTETGFADGTTLSGWLAVDATNPKEYKAALWLFENLFFGFELPDAWLDPAPQASGFTFDVAGEPNPKHGHCVVGVGFTAEGVIIDSWGLLGLITDAAIARYCVRPYGELYTMLSPDMINAATGKAENGFDWDQLVSDFDTFGGGRLPPPAVRARNVFAAR